jgi:hypothetical protein
MLENRRPRTISCTYVLIGAVYAYACISNNAILKGINDTHPMTIRTTQYQRMQFMIVKLMTYAMVQALYPAAAADTCHYG